MRKELVVSCTENKKIARGKNEECNILQIRRLHLKKVSLDEPAYAGPSARMPVPISPCPRADGHTYTGRNEEQASSIKGSRKKEMDLKEKANKEQSCSGKRTK